MSPKTRRRELKRTAFAQQAVDFSDYFDMLFEKVVVAGEVPRTPCLAAPDGISTGGGKQARQHIVLKPEVETSLTHTVGWVDQTLGMVELRSYEYLAEQHRQRFGKKPFPLDRVTYEAFVQKAKDFFTREKLPVRIESAPRSAAEGRVATGSAAAGRGMLILVAVLVGLLAGAVAAAVYFALR